MSEYNGNETSEYNPDLDQLNVPESFETDLSFKEEVDAVRLLDNSEEEAETYRWNEVPAYKDGGRADGELDVMQYDDPFDLITDAGPE